MTRCAFHSLNRWLAAAADFNVGKTMLRPTIAAALVLSLHGAASAWEYRVRFVERIGAVDTPLIGDTIDASSTEPRRIRVQFGVFDDDAGPAPAGGFIGWNVGSIVVSGSADNSAERRTRGRIPPFNFSRGLNADGVPWLPPGGDIDFQMLTDIDATVGTQAPFWPCDPAGTPAPMPPAAVHALNDFASLFEITIDPRAGGESYTVTISGNLIAATEWRVVGSPIPPDCGDPSDPNDNTPGLVVYAPAPTPPESVDRALSVVVPAPGGVLLGACGLVAFVRRRTASRSEQSGWCA